MPIYKKIKNKMGTKIPKTVNHAPLPVMPFLPRIIKSPDNEIIIRETENISENQVHQYCGL